MSVYGTGSTFLILEVFLGRLFVKISLAEAKDFLILEIDIKVSFPDFPGKPLFELEHKSNNMLLLFSSVPPSKNIEVTEY